jgi:transcriptional regulator with PAS, ATPase and Fis domain
MERISKKLNKRMVDISIQVMDTLMDYAWPGNVRELENFIELAVNTEALPRWTQTWTPPTSKESIFKDQSMAEEEPPLLSLEELERHHIEMVYQCCHGNVSRAAKALGIGRNTLYRKLEGFGIVCIEKEQRIEMEQ